MCKEIQLVIEVDGITHDTKQAQDRRKTEELERAGFLVFRFTDEEVLANIGGVASKIEQTVREIERSSVLSQRVPN
jgi:very-short-patch-repair endonuclease